MKPTITIIIPAYNEEKNINSAVDNAKKSINGLFSDYEILIFDDCSRDKTGLIADELAKNDNRIKVIHNPKNRGLGYNYKEGIRLANKEYTMYIPGDNETTVEGRRETMENIGKADIIIPYPANPKIRPLFRRIISKSFIILMNKIMSLNLKYYTGSILYKSKLVKSVKIISNDFAAQAEILSKLLKLGYSFMEVRSEKLRKKQHGNTNIFKLKNLASILRTIIYMFLDIKIKNRKIYNKKPIRVGD